MHEKMNEEIMTKSNIEIRREKNDFFSKNYDIGICLCSFNELKS